MPSLTAWWPPSTALTPRVWCRHRRDHLEFRSPAKRVVLFSDPDTLRKQGYSGWTATRAAVKALEDHGVAIVLWGNETRTEMELLQSDLHLHHPFISENGGGLFVGHGYFRDGIVSGRSTQNYHVVDFGKPYYRVAEALHEVARRGAVDVVGFSDMSIQDVARECGLSLSQARLAKLREYDEPFRIVGSEPAKYSRMCGALRRLGFCCFTHETFHHATGVADRAQSIRLLASLYRHNCHGHVLTIGLAKEASETCLLQAVDVPLVIQSGAVDAARLGLKVPTAGFIAADSPDGWCEAILQLIAGARE